VTERYRVDHIIGYETGPDDMTPIPVVEELVVTRAELRKIGLSDRGITVIVAGGHVSADCGRGEWALTELGR
jgi:hypothetical protein